MRRLAAIVTALTSCAASWPLAAQGAPTAPGPDCHVAYAELGHAFLRELGENGVPTLPALLAAHYDRLLLSDFDLRVPRAWATTRPGVATVGAIATALLDLQERLLAWTPADPGAVKARQAELKALRKQVVAWAARPGSAPLPQLAGDPDPCVLVLAPDRRAFVGFVGWLGLWKQDYVDFWWNDGTAQFVDLRLPDEGQVQLIALEYPAPDQRGDVTLGYDMNTREKTGLLQHVLQRAGLSWCWRWLGDRGDLCFELGFATDLVVDVLGQNNARSGGSGKAHSTEGQGGFIPGAPSAGGGMPVQDADSKWRLSHGEDWFLRPLRQAQKEGAHAAKQAKDKHGHFLVLDQAGAKKFVVGPPFVGAAAFTVEEVPLEFRDDYLEFHRAYRGAFVHWLQSASAKTKGSSMTRFGELLRRLIDPAEPKRFDALCEDLYGVPVSAEDPEIDTLERRFLIWLGGR